MYSPKSRGQPWEMENLRIFQSLKLRRLPSPFVSDPTGMACRTSSASLLDASPNLKNQTSATLLFAHVLRSCAMTSSRN